MRRDLSSNLIRSLPGNIFKNLSLLSQLWVLAREHDLYGLVHILDKCIRLELLVWYSHLDNPICSWQIPHFYMQYEQALTNTSHFHSRACPVGNLLVTKAWMHTVAGLSTTTRSRHFLPPYSKAWASPDCELKKPNIVFLYLYNTLSWLSAPLTYTSASMEFIFLYLQKYLNAAPVPNSKRRTKFVTSKAQRSSITWEQQ